MDTPRARWCCRQAACNRPAAMPRPRAHRAPPPLPAGSRPRPAVQAWAGGSGTRAVPARRSDRRARGHDHPDRLVRIVLRIGRYPPLKLTPKTATARRNPRFQRMIALHPCEIFFCHFSPDLLAGLSTYPHSHLMSFADNVAGGEQHRGPHERRREIGDLEAPERHLENAGDQRHRGAQRPEEAADEDAERAPFLDERFALRDEVRMARQRPDVLHACVRASCRSSRTASRRAPRRPRPRSRSARNSGRPP